ncbi:ricin-type beta-trefoil lectin domain protein [Sphaerisporangium sp. NPDC051011]|uniref:ricin-type beta-trefoil lectin domain protein n=1 Tax=Sphaerisporangium sp. NPDC051011 TaxID=3155792 RepID=UPI00340789B9
MKRLNPARSRARLLTGALLASLTLIVAGLGLVTPAYAATGQITGIGGKCVDVDNANSANRTQVQLYTCNGTGAQQWTTGSDGTVRALGKCLDVDNANSANGTKVQIYDCNGTVAQAWTTGANGSLRALGKCLDATNGNSADRTPLQLYDCNGTAAQNWTLPSGGGTTPGKMAGAPYLYMGWGNPPNPGTVMDATGIRSFTMAFILSSGGCNAAWDGQRGLTGGADQQAINTIKSKGGSVQVSFGGWSGNKLGPNCSSPEAYANAVQSVINAVGPAVVDFDIENTDEFENYTVQDRILNALKIVKQNNPGVKVVVTFGTLVSGPNYHGTRLINQSRALNVPIDNYTIMPFDFGGGNMYNDTVSASEGLKNALKNAWGWSDAQAYAHMGISGMNGLSDQSEVTSPGTWTQIRDWARSKGLTRFAYWSVNRDRAGGAGVPSGEWEFTRITAGF